MSDSTLRQHKENLIHLVGDGWLTEAYDLKDGEKLLDLIERCESDIRIELEALCQEVAREARLDELKSIVGWRSDAKDAVLIRPEFRHRPLAENVDSRRQMLVIERVAELTQKPAEETEGQ